MLTDGETIITSKIGKVEIALIF